MTFKPVAKLLGLAPDYGSLYSFISVKPVPMLWFEPPVLCLKPTWVCSLAALRIRSRPVPVLRLPSSCTVIGVHVWRGYTPMPRDSNQATSCSRFMARIPKHMCKYSTAH